ncbi:MAG: (d)CMP kinase [Alphaproteobacteria bacterium]|nr:(d)CMP kinase [Alphaproteobacteria bacterium]
MIITIDGPASAGKGTLANSLSKKYGLAYFDTGMVYRAVGLQMVLSGTPFEDVAKAEDFAQKLDFPTMMELAQHKDFRSDVGGKAASVVAAIPGVRSALLKMQQDFAKNPVFANGQKANGAVYDGRDTGTVVCPNADVKLFITASPEVRAERRHKEFLSKGIDKTYAEVLEQIKERDDRDEKRASAPLKPAEDAIIFDTSEYNAEQVLEKVCQIVDSY